MMYWIKYVLFLIVSFVGCLLFLFFYPWWPLPTDQPYEIGSWRDFTQDNLIVEIDSDKIVIQKNYAVIFQKKGHWEDHNFYCDSPEDSVAQDVVASELSNEDLDLQMKYFDRSDSSVLTCTKTHRGTDELYPYPTAYTSGLVVTYPPPKGLIRIGMLQADLDALPWTAYAVDLGHDDNNADLATNVYKYRSDNPNLPELHVSVLKGRVIEVSGGAEDTADPPYVLPPPEPIPRDEGSPNLAGALIDLYSQKR